MRFALVENIRSEAISGQHGVCPFCRQPVIAKCGRKRISHWAHKANYVCDRWWESEEEWHRTWKSFFPADWQEKRCSNEDEWHVADICTDYGLVIEFQHSHLSETERETRENFYGNMIWVVDGTRLKNDYKRFRKGIMDLDSTGVSNPRRVFPDSWIASSKPVIFDFRKLRNDDLLVCLLPDVYYGIRCVRSFSSRDFIDGIKSGELFILHRS